MVFAYDWQDQTLNTIMAKHWDLHLSDRRAHVRLYSRNTADAKNIPRREEDSKKEAYGVTIAATEKEVRNGSAIMNG
jgi:hypothetical protein